MWDLRGIIVQIGIPDANTFKVSARIRQNVVQSNFGDVTLIVVGHTRSDSGVMLLSPLHWGVCQAVESGPVRYVPVSTAVLTKGCI